MTGLAGLADLPLDQITATAAVLAALLGLIAVILVLLQGGRGAGRDRRQYEEAESLRRSFHTLDQGLRGELAAGIRDALSTAFDKVQAGVAAQSDALDRFGRSQRETVIEGNLAIQAVLLSFKTQVSEALERSRAESAAQLDEMRRVVDERLQSALEKQLKDSFASLQEQLGAVQQAIGQVQSVAGEVGDLKRLFSNVKSRGGWGEAQLEAMLTDMLPVGTFEKNFRVRETTTEQVEFALRVPGRGGEHAWLAIDSKFPTEDYARLVAAHEAGLYEEEAIARAALAARLRVEGQRIGAKYIAAPRTLDFALLYVPSDSLFAEIARVPGLIEALRHDHHVMVMGPSLLPAFLHTLRVSYATLALEQKASEIGETLRGVKVEWSRFGEALVAIKKQAETLSNGIDASLVRQRAVGRTLREVEETSFSEEKEAKRLLSI